MRMEQGFIIFEGDYLYIPKDREKCPYCGGQLIAKIDAETDDEEHPGLLIPEIELECEDEEEFSDDHSDMPYVNWLPVEDRVNEWIKEKYRTEQS